MPPGSDPPDADALSGPLAPTRADLEQAYAARGEDLAGHAKAEAVLCDGDRITVLCTLSGPGGSERTVLLQLDANGEVLRRRGYGEEHGAGRALAALPDGGNIVVGELQRGPLDFAAHVMRLDTEGDVADERALGEGGDAGLASVAMLADGSAVAGGTRQGTGWLLLDRSERTLDDVAAVTSIAAIGDGFALAATREPSTTALGLTYLATFDGDRRERWRLHLPASGRAEPAAVAVTGEGDVVAVGHREEDAHAPVQLWVVRVGASGEQLWERTLGGEGETRRGRAVALLPGGDIALAGEAARAGERRLVVARLGADGTTVWERAFDEHDEVVRGLAATADGGVVAAGSTTASKAGRTEAFVRRLDGSGAPVWTRTLHVTD